MTRWTGIWGHAALAACAMLVACETQAPSTGGPAPRNFEGTPGDDKFAGKGADDVIRGGAGDDFLRGSEGNDHLLGDEGDDKFLGGGGDDRIEGGPGNDHVGGGDGDDYLFGGPGDDYLYGGPGKDHLEGGGGKDTLRGEEGVDLLVGGPEADIFEFWLDSSLTDDAGSGQAVDKVKDFNPDEGDVLDLTKLLYEGSYAGDGSAESFENYLRLKGNILEIDPLGRGEFTPLAEFENLPDDASLERWLAAGAIRFQ